MLETLKCTVRRFIAKDTFTMGAALSYYTAFSLAPLLIIAIAVAGFVFGDEAASGQVAAEIEHAVGPEVGQAVQAMIKNARESGQAGTATVLGVIALLFGAGGVFGQLQTSLNTVWDVPPKAGGGLWGMIRRRFLSFAMVLGICFMLLVSLAASAAISALSKSIAPGTAIFAQLINQVISFLFITVLFAVMYQVLPDRDIAWRDVWVGAAFTSLLFAIGKYVLGLYLGRGSATSSFGAAGSLAVILLWVYYASQLLLFGAQFTFVYGMRRTDPNWTCDTGVQPQHTETGHSTERREPAAAAV